MNPSKRNIDTYEEEQQILDPHRVEEQRVARLEAESRLASRGIGVEKNDPDETVADLLDAIERFENAVERRGGDLMVNRIGSSEPQDPAFVPPVRQPGEDISTYTQRVEIATHLL
ncbi:MAG: hypothetical protein ABI679_09185 [Gemmatimonadota bacterium]